jgi:hypothetical protein
MSDVLDAHGREQKEVRRPQHLRSGVPFSEKVHCQVGAARSESLPVKVGRGAQFDVDGLDDMVTGRHLESLTIMGLAWC